MTENFYRTGRYKPDHTTYAGELTQFDFEGHHTMATMAQRIRTAIAFDKQCEKNIKLRKNQKQWEEKKNVIKAS